MLQNHMLQLLCLVAMEPPASMDPDSVRNEKVKILRSLRPLTGDVGSLCVRGQYRQYPSERGEATDTETYVALCAYIDNWRWAGVPFFMRTGKRMPEKRTQIVIQFKPVPYSIFVGAASRDLVANKLVIDLQPEEDISISLMNKTPGLDRGGFRLSPLPLSLSLTRAFSGRRRIAYERLLLDVIDNNSTLFVRRDEVEASWSWIDGVRSAWAEGGVRVAPYESGSWGPPSAYAMVARLGRSWNE
jgi:glucose-6-phosphate 1-dehydrogenase